MANWGKQANIKTHMNEKNFSLYGKHSLYNPPLHNRSVTVKLNRCAAISRGHII